MALKTINLDVIRGRTLGWRRALVRRTGVRVFGYHGVVERKTDTRLERNLHPLAAFREHVWYLKRQRVISLAELEHGLTSGSKRLEPAAVITFDDGYKNNLLAGEVLADAGLPWSVFVSTGAVDKGGCIWTVELSLLVLHGNAPCLDALEKTWPLHAASEREAAFQTIRFAMKAMPSEKRRSTLDSIRDQFPAGETERLLAEYPSLRMLSWDELAALPRSGVEVGSHGVEHEIHHHNHPAEVRVCELVESRKQIERNLGKPCRYFVYPNGGFNDSSPAELRSAGYALGLTTQQRAVTMGCDPLLLPRIEPPASLERFVSTYHWAEGR